jgi:hypothetical protein
LRQPRQPDFALLAGGRIDTGGATPNNARMAEQEVVRRMKSYSAATGYVYQYFFRAVETVRRGFRSGNEYVYMVSADRKSLFPVRIFVRRDAVEKWSARAGRPLTGTEEYAAAKMRLFAAFDEVEDLASARPELEVNASNLDALLGQLDI